MVSFHHSSDDELAVEGLKRQNQQAESDSENDFEKEMDMELENVMRTYENSQGRNGLCAFNQHNQLSSWSELFQLCYIWQGSYQFLIDWRKLDFSNICH